MGDQKLILDLIQRIESLRLVQGNTVSNREELLKQNEDTLVKLTLLRHNAVIFGLANLLDRIKTANYGADMQDKIDRTQLDILRLINRCLKGVWDTVREDAESVADPPPFEVELARFLLQQLGYYILNSHPNFETELRAAAGDILMYLSASNFDVVFARIKAKINALAASSTEKDDETSDLLLLEYLSMSEARLSGLFLELSRSIRRVGKKSQVIIARTLRQAIWNWIDRYPMEFVAVCRSGQKMKGNPHTLFDAFADLGDNNKRRAAFWPVQTMLLILCPDDLLEVQQNASSDSSKANFLNEMSNGFKVKGLADVAAMSYIDLCKAGTYVEKTDLSALRFLIPKMERELQAKLFDAPLEKFRTKSVDSMNGVELTVDCLVSFYRLNALKSLDEYFNRCFNHESPPSFKLAMVGALLKLTVEANPAIWKEGLDKGYDRLSGPLRAILHEYRQRFATMNNESGKKRKEQELREMDTAILKHTLDLFEIHPTLFIYNTSQDVESVKAETKELLIGLISILEPMAQADIYDSAMACLLQVFDPDYIREWCKADVYSAFYEISGGAVDALASSLLSLGDFGSSVENDVIGDLLFILHNILKRRMAFLRQERNAIAGASSESIQSYYSCHANLEAALLVSLCSSDVTHSATALKCISLCCEEIELINENTAAGAVDLSETMAANYSTYASLANLGKKVMGRQHQQLEVRKLLRRMEHSTDGNVSGWNEMFSRWQGYIEIVFANEEPGATDASAGPSTTTVDKGKRTGFFRTKTAEKSEEGLLKVVRLPAEDVRNEWLSYVGALSALGGVKVSARGQNVTEFDDFLHLFQSLIVSEFEFIRETTLKTVAPSLSVAVYPATFRMFGSKMDEFVVNGTPVETEANSLAVEQMIDVVRRILENPQETADELTLVDFETLLCAFVDYACLISSSADTARIRFKLAYLLEYFLSKRHLIAFKNEVLFRNRMVDRIISWTSDGGTKDQPTPAPQVGKSKDISNELIEVFKLDLATMKAAAELLMGLMMCPLDKADRESTPAKTDLFLRYFTFFTNQLDWYRRCAASTNKDRFQKLANLAIQCLANLLSANIDLGFEYFVSQGYSADLETRTAFIKVLTNILKQGTEFAALADASAPDRYAVLLDLLLEEDLAITMALISSVPVSDSDRVATVLVRVFSTAGRIMSLLQFIIEHEVDITISFSTLFRRNSMATKFLSAYCKELFRGYLRDVLSEPITYIANSTDDFEIDPDRLAPGADVAESAGNLLNAADMLLSAIINSQAQCPPQLRYVTYVLANAVGGKFENGTRTAVAGFLFLRYFCPAIVAPDGHGILNEPIKSSGTRRALVLLTKILQNLANGVAFGSKELYMDVASPFVDSNLARMHKYLDDMGSPFPRPPDTASPADCVIEDQLLEDLQEVHRQLVYNSDRMMKSLRASDDIAAGLNNSSATGALASPTGGDGEDIPPPPPRAADVSGLTGASDESGDGKNDHSGKAAAEPPSPVGATGPPRPTGTVGARPELLSGEKGALRGRAGTMDGVTRRDPAASPGSRYDALKGGGGSGAVVEEESVNSSRLTAVLATMGPAPERVDKSAQVKKVVSGAGPSVASNQRHNAFMDMYKDVNTEHIAKLNLFYQGGVSRQGAAVFYLIARRVGNHPPIEYIVQILRTLREGADNPFDVVIDVSMFSPANMVQTTFITKFFRVIPQEAVANIHAVYFLNANEEFKRYASGVVSSHVSFSAMRIFHFCHNITALEEFIAQNELKLPAETLAIDTDTKTLFKDVINVSAQKARQGCELAITNEHIILTGTQPLTMFQQQQKVLVRDIYRLTDVAAIRNERSAHMFTIQFNDERKLTLQSPGTEQIMHNLKLAMAGLDLTKAEEGMRKFRPEDVPGTLLNMALLNLGSDDSGLRLAAYDLLHALCVSFNFSTQDELVQADCLYIPENTAGFVVRLSTKLSAAETHLSLEFLRESLASFKNESNNRKHLCLQYMSPWLPTLALYLQPSPADEAAEKVARVAEIVNTLITLTLNEPDMYPSIQNLVWATLGRVTTMLPVTLDSFLDNAVAAGYFTREAEVIADTMVTLAAESPTHVAGRIISRLRANLETALPDNARSIQASPAWAEIAVLARFLLKMTFHDHVDLKNFLPELFHVVVMMLSTGPPDMRTTVHNIIINVVQSLCGASDILTEEVTTTLRFRLRELSDPRFKFLFGVSGKRSSAQKIQGMDLVASMLHDIIVCCQVGDSHDLAFRWLTRWQGLTAACAFRHNIALQPRAFVVLGVVAPRPAGDNLICEVLHQLRDVIENIATAEDYTLAVALIMCLGRFCASMPRDSRYFDTMFWLTISLLSIGVIELFPALLNLLETVLKNMEAHACFVNTSFTEFMLNTRGPVAAACADMDTITGLSFEQNFSFALTGVLLRSLKDGTSKAWTIRVLNTLLNVAGKGGVDPSVLGYLATLIVVHRGDINQIPVPVNASIDPAAEDGSARSGIPDFSFLFSQDLLPDRNTEVLLLTLLATLLDSSEYESDQLFIYSLLGQAVEALPEIFPVTYEILIKRMSSILATSQNAQVIDAVQSIMQSMVSLPNTDAALTLTYLNQFGFGGLPSSILSHDQVNTVEMTERKIAIARLSGALIGKVIDQSNE